MGLGDEAERLARVLGNQRLVLMGNHGFLALEDSVAQVFDDLFYYERAAETLITAYSTGRELRVACRKWRKRRPSSLKITRNSLIFI